MLAGKNSIGYNPALVISLLHMTHRVLLNTIAATVITFSLVGTAMAAHRRSPPRQRQFPRQCTIVCPSGKTYPACTPEGYPINYFINPCRFG
ncbi:hypothetical protein A3D88_04125 [Candidatus Peribacteria bacterium RIFCSPHIGHO2_02_FULL_52_16]|nr:MAG: hypothetical protein A2706_03480 [Candidatus Peribacteria bacterium RIFCSPHIGHO2_01_FULL_51_35]OGJ60759.1 MAG: hypothetical protein A3D88_04125 [Candidatus Peribacteria bacterium RIFCSPHIGHO2_02_FULL_52_16]